MHFGNRLYQLREEGKAVGFFNGRGATLTWVFEGPYAGMWAYKKNCLEYHLPTFAHMLERYTKKDDTQAWATMKYPTGWHCLFGEDKVSEERDNILRAVLNRTLNSEQVIAYEAGIAQLYDLAFKQIGRLKPPYFNSEILKGTLRILYGMHPELVTLEATQHPVAFAHKACWLAQAQWLVTSMGSRKRARFLGNVLKHGAKKALRKSFPRTCRRLINDLASGGDMPIDASFVSLSRKPISLHALIGVRESYQRFGKRNKSNRLEDKPLLTFLFQVGSKYGNEALTAWSHLRFEQERVDDLGLDIKYPIYQVENAVTYNTWHDHLSTRVRDYYRKSEAERHQHCEGIHREHWSGWELEGFRPLIKAVDFDNEGDHMHHCVGGYFTSTNHMFAHIDYEGEEATVQFGKDGIRQLYGQSNHPVSAELRAFVVKSLEPYFKAEHAGDDAYALPAGMLPVAVHQIDNDLPW